MLPPLLDQTHPTPADKWLWALLGFLVVGQIVALWLLCQQQVERAVVREAALRAERIALRDDCAPRNGRATCPAVPAQQPRNGDVNGVMAALR